MPASTTTNSGAAPQDNNSALLLRRLPTAPSSSAAAVARKSSRADSDHDHRHRPRRGGSQSYSSLLRIIAVAISLVLAFHWYLVLHHVNHHAPRDGHHHRGAAWRGRWGQDDDEKRARGVWGRGGGSSRGNQNADEKEPYVLSPACGGCYRSYSDDKNVPCHDLIQKLVEESKSGSNGGNSSSASLSLSLRDASHRIGTTVGGCGVCDPATCHDRYGVDDGGEGGGDHRQQQRYQTKYWRFDRTAPKFTNPTSLVLPSIPDSMRLPPDKYRHVENYTKHRYAAPDPENITQGYLFEYNPGLAQIPDKMRAYLPWNARYLLSLRVTPHNYCFGEWLTDALTEDVKQTMHSLNHLGLALLDENYKLIPGHDVVIDVDRQLGARRDNYMGEPAFVDFRLFALNDEMYLHVNSDTVIVTRLKLRSKDGAVDPKVLKEEDERDERMAKQRKETQFRLKNLYGGDRLEVTLTRQFNTVWGKGRNAVFGKNYALFSIPNAIHPNAPDAVYAEMEIFPNHMVQQILPDDHDWIPKDRRIKWRQRRNFKIDHIIQRRVLNVGNETVSSGGRNWGGKPLPSFFSADEAWFPGGKNPFKEFAHGGACCVPLSMDGIADLGGKRADAGEGFEGVDSVLVGVGHTLVKYYSRNKMPVSERMLVPDTNYVSFFYAFDPRPPFKVLARSGYFCLGFASEDLDEEGGTINPHSVLTHNRPLRQNNETFACPQIHYIETIIEKAGDPSSVVIGYGMNDCTARLVEVRKEEIARLLFPDPWDMVLSETTT